MEDEFQEIERHNIYTYLSINKRFIRNIKYLVFYFRNQFFLTNI